MTPQILTEVNASPAPTPANELMWRLARRSNRVRQAQTAQDPLPVGEVHDAFYKSFRRALKQLIDDKAIRCKKRELENVDEVVAIYPFRTRDVRILELRQRLLPQMRTHLLETGDRQFGHSSNEDYHVDEATDAERAGWRARWQRIENKLCQELATTPERETLLAIATRGRELFFRTRRRPSSDLSSNFHHAKALGDLFDSLSKSGAHRDLVLDASAFFTDWLPPSRKQHLELKSQLYSIWDGGMRQRPSLKLAFKQTLRDRSPALVQKLPKYAPPRKDAPNSFVRYEERFDPILDQLLGRDVFAEFEFLSPN
jgi:hypothetical protein